MTGHTADNGSAAKSGNSSPTSARGGSPAQDELQPDHASSAASSFSDDADTYSLDDVMTDYPRYFGRTYHKYKEGSYVFPNDDKELERMEWQWMLMKAAQNQAMFYAPVTNPRQILEVGTGTGIWVTTVAEEIFPEAKITGIDLSTRGLPPVVAQNVCFEQQDCTDENWCRERGSIDFIYSQSMLGALQDFKQYLINARSYLTPGTGWIECCEPDFFPHTDDDTIPENWPVTAWAQWQERAGHNLGRPLRIAPRLKQWMSDAGYVDITETIYKMPLGSWPADKKLKRLGSAFRELFDQSLQTASLYLFKTALGWGMDEIELFLAGARAALRDKKVHSYLRCHVVYGRRPTVDEEKKMGRMAPPPKPVPRNTVNRTAQAQPVT